MKITLNHIEESFSADTLSVTELLKEKNFTFKMIVVKVNGRVIKTDQYPTTIIHDKDEVTVLHLISGG